MNKYCKAFAFSCILNVCIFFVGLYTVPEKLADYGFLISTLKQNVDINLFWFIGRALPLFACFVIYEKIDDWSIGLKLLPVKTKILIETIKINLKK